MAKSSLVVLHVPAGGGHRAAANAVAEAARVQGFEAEVLDALNYGPGWFKKAYVAAHLGSSTYVPTFYGGAFFASNHRVEGPDDLMRSVDRAIGAGLIDEMVRRNPAAIVATHFYPLKVLADARSRGLFNAPVIGVVTDYVAHAIWAETKADMMCSPAGRAAEDLARNGIDPSRIVATGIPIRPAFSAIAEMDEIDPSGDLQVLVTCGGFGVGPMLDVLRSFTGVRNTQLTVVCGDNPHLVRRASHLCARRGLDAEVVGFERDMPSRIARAHVVVGKPGGLTVSECLAAGRPMMLVGAVPGQETCNQEWLEEQGAALRSRPRKVGSLVTMLRKDNRLGEMARKARALGRPRAADSVVEVVKTLVSRAAPKES